MELFDVYPRFQVEIDHGEGNYVWDAQGRKYLDFYGGHAVICIGHGHPHYKKRIKDQLDKIGFYSNSVVMPIQEELAEKTGRASGYEDYRLFLINSGAEAVENAIKMASFKYSGRRVIAFENAFHGRTSAAVQLTDNPKITSDLNKGIEVVRLPLNDADALRAAMNDEVAAVIVEGIQGIGGMAEPDGGFLHEIQNLCREYRAAFILDEIQSGFGRTGRFFAHQIHDGLKPDLITMAKGMGNGFPVAGLLIAPHFEASPGMLGTTFGGNPLACAASLAVLEVMETEHILDNVLRTGALLEEELKSLPAVKNIRGRGLMLALDFDFPIREIRNHLIFEEAVFTGSAKDPNTMRLLPPLTVKEKEIDIFVTALRKTLKNKI